MKLAYVVPRYGDEVVGGAEQAVQMLAERLVGRGATVEVLTTRAVDARSWANHYAEGFADLRGVRVTRFSASGRHPQFDQKSEPVLARPDRASPADEARWLDQQGPLSPDLVEAVRTTDADLVVCSPYLFHPTVAAAGAAPHPVVLHPAAHDEAVLRLPMYRDLFVGAAGLVFYTRAEQQLVGSRFAVATAPQIVLGLGCDPAPAELSLPPDPLGLGDRPYLLCLGRVEGAKGTDALALAFARLKEREPGPLALVFAGPVSNQPPPHPDIFVAGLVDEATKWALLRSALALVSPSAHESFGIVLLEAWQAGIPVVVNAASAATREHCERSGGGLWYQDQFQLQAAIRRLLRSPVLRTTMSQRGLAYADSEMQWPVILDRYLTFLRARIDHR